MELFLGEGDMEKIALKTYGRTPEKFYEEVTMLKEWMRTQPHLPEILDDKYISNFFLLNKCSVEKTKQKIDMYYTIRSVVPDFFEHNNPKLPALKEIMEITYLVPLPKLTEDNYRITVNRLRNPDLIDKKQPIAVMKYTCNVLELRLREDFMLGDILILDLEGLNFGYFTKFTPSILKSIFGIYEKVYSTPMKGFYIVNSKPFLQNFLKLIKKFMKPKIFARIYVCDDTSILNERFPKEILPRDYGGEEKSLEELRELLLQKFKQHEERFDQLDMLRVNEDLRPEKLDNDDVLGFYGNFTKLDVD